MTDQKKTPASLRRQAEGITGVRDTAESVAPGWSRKRQAPAYLRFQGKYYTPGELSAAVALDAVAHRTGGGAEPHGDRLSPCPRPDEQLGAAGSPASENPGTHPDYLRKTPVRISIDGATGEILPCRSLETTQPNGLTGPHRKTAAALSWNVAHLCQKYGHERVGFLTLTFADHVLCPKEAQRRFNSLATHVLKVRYLDYIRVIERQKSGRLHYHLLVVLPDDIRTGFDFGAVADQDYSSANNHLRREWAFWRKTARGYGFGRTELMPVKGSGEALGHYVGKYIGKHIGFRKPEDKGVRLVAYTRGARMATSRHTAVGSQVDDAWRGKVLTFARQMTVALRAKNPNHPGIETMDDLAFNFGKRWAYHWRDYIFSLPPSDLSVPF